jgi:LPPG:FO 2-phospho-L-lactate transferase
LRAGETLSAVTADFARRLGIGAALLPMSDDKVRTRLRTAAGWLDFQDYFVRQQCRPVVEEIAFAGAETARALPAFLAALAEPGLRAVVICPSNPFISVEPILAVPGVRAAMRACAAPVIAVSPIIGGRAVKGPTAKMMTELGMTPSAAEVERRYGDLLDGYVIDHADEDAFAGVSGHVVAAQTLMNSIEDKDNLARVVLAAADEINGRR